MRIVPHRNHRSRRLLRRTGTLAIEALGLRRRRASAPPAPPSASAAGPVEPPAAARRVVCVSGEPHFVAGHLYRVERVARTLTELGWSVEIHPVNGLDATAWDPKTLPPTVVLIWRAAWSPRLEEAVAAWRGQGARILFDVDDYMFEPGLATPEVIDGIRSQGIAPLDVMHHYAAVRRTLLLADMCLVPTQELADRINCFPKPALVSVNGFDDDTYRVSREAVLRRRASPGDGLLRIGYASGSRTHQRDFRVAAAAVARVLRTRPACRLVLFRDPHSGLPMLDLAEFPDFAGLEDRVEWRTMTDLRRLPEELARFDVNLAPLEVGNVFCEAKSELKYFEAALVGVPTIASPTQPYRTAIVNGVTGCLAAHAAEWRRHLDRLLDDAPLRARIGQAALHHVLHRYGPDGRRQRLAGVMARVLGGPAEAAAAFRLECQERSHGTRLPQGPQAEVLERWGNGTIARAAVVVPLYNYASFVGEALDSVRQQSLESLELVIVDDHSSDASVAVATTWLRQHAGRFVSATLLRNTGNKGLPLTRNTGFAHAEAPFIFPLDADNRLEPDCLRLLVERLDTSAAAAVHPTLQRFGECTIRNVAQPWAAERLRHGNYIDAMALIRKSAWAHVGGYAKGGYVGWEDYDLWCRFIEAGLWSEPVPEAVAGYRVHRRSMLHTRTNVAQQAVVAAIRSEHPWLTVRAA